MGEPNTLGREPIEVRRLDDVIAVGAEGFRAVIVRDEHHDVAGLGEGGSRDKDPEENQQGSQHAGSIIPRSDMAGLEVAWVFPSCLAFRSPSSPFIVFSGSAHAQTAQIACTITDPTNAVVPGATLTIVNVDTNDARVAVSNDRGQYNMPFLPSGRYRVTCELAGFQTTRREGIVLETDQEVRVDFPLKPGPLTESVTVVGTPVLASDTSSIGQVVTGQTISDLPLNGRNFLQLARLATGVLESAAGDRAAEGGAFVANGARSVLRPSNLNRLNNPKSVFTKPGPMRRNEIQIRIEAFNVFNEPHYRQPNATVDLLDAGRITGIVGTMREMQIGIKYLF